MKAIVFESHAGHTKAYAQLLGKKLNLSVYSLQEAKAQLAKGDEILFMGWMMAGILKGWKKAKRRYAAKAVCAVGMATHTEEAARKIGKKNGCGEVPIFMIRGGLDMDKLKPLYRMMMEKLLSFLEKKQDRPADMQGLIDVARSKEDLPVTEEAVSHVIGYFEA